MLATTRVPLGAPGVFALPEVAEPLLHPQRMDACAFVGVAPRGPARVPLGSNGESTGWRRVVDAGPVQRSVPVAVRSFDDYRRHFGGFEGPGLLPQAVASFFEQGGRRAWVLRIVQVRSARFDDRCASGTLSGGFTSPIDLIARSEGEWGNRLSASVSFSVTGLALTFGAGGRIEADARTPLQAGDTLRLTDADGHLSFARVSGLTRLRDPLRARERKLVELDTVPPYPPVRAELVEAVLEIDDGDGRRERFEHLALAADHPLGLANVLCENSALLWPHPGWAGSDLWPARKQCEQLLARTGGFHDGKDAWGELVPDDFFDPLWSAADEIPGSGITALAAIAPLTQVCVPDLYLPAQWAGPEFIAEVPRGTAGAEFSACVVTEAIPQQSSVPPAALTGLMLDPRTQSGLDAIIALQQRVVAYCEDDLRIALLDVPPGLSQGRIEHWRASFDSSWVAAYHPWLIPARRKNDDVEASQVYERRLTPSAAAAGIIARRELEHGIQWGPANEVAREVVHVAEPQPEGRADALHPLGINCYVREPRGIALVAARTLARDAQWRQLSVRRLLLMLRRALLADMQWVVFEPNGPALWRDVRHAIESLLRGLFRAGAFAGRTEGESFFVRVLTERVLLDRGELVVEIGVAPAEPLEFILVRLRRDADGTLNLEE
ncbi:phage tail sheath subtilisin-like domain-containing protein [Ramlibacter sp. XY19]|uniref:phage tail sheath C-terminal domain-containing protein n=1 Tax=Ramlibacter paludis TaxID=2908000 RepID=UPI0023DAF034|nr:phage tail sheath C-terminal domain-containing protein [Ramlibacter paludis]MCG2593181.1 phage tail sheath subtilisin-like domain-containing protein [Ramlibacter paludis]